MAKQINLVINGKGGVGKSFFATNFVQYLKDRGIAHCAIDSDQENSTLKRFHPDSDFINLEQRREIDHVFIAAESADLLVIDASTDLFMPVASSISWMRELAMAYPAENTSAASPSTTSPRAELSGVGAEFGTPRPSASPAVL